MIRRSRWILPLIALLLMALPGESLFAQGSPPMLLDDTGTPGPGHWEINLVTAFVHGNASTEWQVPLVDVNYGLGSRIQLKGEIPFEVERNEGGGSRSKMGGAEFGVKYRFVGEDDSDVSLSCYPQTVIPVLSGEEGGLFLPMEFHLEQRTFGLTAELGHAWTGDRPDGWETGTAVAFFFDRLELLLGWHTCLEDGSLESHETMINLGLIWEVSESGALMFSLGKGLDSRSGEPDFRGLSAIQILL